MPHRNDHDAALARVAALEAENARLRSALDGDGLAHANYRLPQAEEELRALEPEIQQASAGVNGLWWMLLIGAGLAVFRLATLNPDNYSSMDAQAPLIVISGCVGGWAAYRIAVNQSPAKVQARQARLAELERKRAQLTAEIEEIHALFASAPVAGSASSDETTRS